MSGPQAESRWAMRSAGGYPVRHDGAQRRAVPGRGGQLVRAAGVAAQLHGQRGRLCAPCACLRAKCAWCGRTAWPRWARWATVDHGNIKLGKAGRSRWMGRRPTTRGSAMTPRDHPHGGGEGKAPIGMPGPKSPWGKPTLGVQDAPQQADGQVHRAPSWQGPRPLTRVSVKLAASSEEAQVMSRSLKKGPFVAPKLLEKVEEMNRRGEKRVIRPGRGRRRSFRRWWATPSRCMMGVGIFPSTSPRTWSGIGWASLRPRGISAVTKDASAPRASANWRTQRPGPGRDGRLRLGLRREGSWK